MEQEIDLRPYVKALINGWKWIIGTAIIFAVVALGISYLRQPVYDAVALVAITNPRQIVQFDPRIQTSEENQPYKAYPELAKSDELLTNVLSEVQSTVPSVTNLDALRELLVAEAGSDPTILRLSAQHHDPQKASYIANTWAELFVVKANEVFGLQGEDQLDYFERQLADAAQKLESTENEYIDFQAQNRSDILESQLTSLEAAQAEQLAKEKQIASVIQDAQSLQDQLKSSRDIGNNVSPNQITAIILQLRAFSGGVIENGSNPWQLQINLDQLTSADLNEQIAFLDSLQGSLLAQREKITAEIAGLEPQILAVQQEKQEEEIQAARLERDLKLAEGTYSALASKVEEEKITTQNTSNGVRLASQAAVPLKPTGQNKLLLIVIGGVIGVLLSGAIIILRTWWRS